MPATSLTRVLNPRYLSYTAPYDVTSNICQAHACHVIDMRLNPRFLRKMASYDVESNSCRALQSGETRARC